MWKILTKLGCSPKFVNLVRHLHEGMNAEVISEGENERALLCNWSKAGLHTVTHSVCSENRGVVSIQYCMVGGLFNLCRLPVTTKLRDLLFADDCALVALSADDMQEIVNSCKCSYQFWITNRYHENGVQVSADSWYMYSKCWQGHFCEW